MNYINIGFQIICNNNNNKIYNNNNNNNNNEVINNPIIKLYKGLSVNNSNHNNSNNNNFNIDKNGIEFDYNNNNELTFDIINLFVNEKMTENNLSTGSIITVSNKVKKITSDAIFYIR